MQGTHTSSSADDGRYAADTTTGFCLYCRVAASEGDARLMRCSRCKVACYCSRTCQKKQLILHNNYCEEIATLTNRLGQLASEFPTLDRFHGDPCAEILEDNDLTPLVGRGYFDTKLKLADVIFQMIYCSTDTIERGVGLYDISLQHNLELLHLASLLGLMYPIFRTTEQGVTRVSLLLIALSRDDDAFTFAVHSAVHRNIADREDWIDVLKLMIRKEPWSAQYPKHSRSGDISRLLPQLSGLDTGLLVSLAIVKLRLIARYDADRQGFSSYLRTSAGKALEQVRSVVQGFVLEPEGWISAQRDNLRRLLACVDQQSPNLFPKIYDMVPFTTENYPIMLTSMSVPVEYWHLLNDFVHLSRGVGDIIDEYYPDRNASE